MSAMQKMAKSWDILYYFLFLWRSSTPLISHGTFSHYAWTWFQKPSQHILQAATTNQLEFVLERNRIFHLEQAFVTVFDHPASISSVWYHLDFFWGS